MNMIKPTLITFALLSSASLFANTTAVGQASSSTEVADKNTSLLQSVKEGVSDSATKVGNGIEKGADKTKTFTKDKWQDTKKFTSEKSEALKDKSVKAKDVVVEDGKKTKNYLGEKTDKAKDFTQEKWQKTKQALTPESKEAGLNSDANLELGTPAGTVKTDTSIQGNVKTQ